MSKKLVLFVCTENRFRSPLAAHYFGELVAAAGMSEKVTADSAGIRAFTGRPAIDLILNDAMINDDGKLNDHRAKMITGELINAADLVITMELNQKEALRVEFPDARSKIKTLSFLADGFDYDISDLNDELEFDRSIIQELMELTKKSLPKIISSIGL